MCAWCADDNGVCVCVAAIYSIIFEPFVEIAFGTLCFVWIIIFCCCSYFGSFQKRDSHSLQQKRNAMNLLWEETMRSDMFVDETYKLFDVPPWLFDIVPKFYPPPPIPWHVFRPFMYAVHITTKPLYHAINRFPFLTVKRNRYVHRRIQR